MGSDLINARRVYVVDWLATPIRTWPLMASRKKKMGSGSVNPFGVRKKGTKKLKTKQKFKTKCSQDALDEEFSSLRGKLKTCVKEDAASVSSGGRNDVEGLRTGGSYPPIEEIVEQTKKMVAS